MFDKVIKYLYYSLFLFTPLIMIPVTSELFEFNKMLFIYLFTSLIVFFWVLKSIVNKKIILKKSSLDIPIGLFLLSLVASYFFSIDKSTSFFGYYGRFNGGLISIISYILLYYGFISNSININGLLKTSLLSSLLVMLWGIPGRLGHDMTCFVITKQFNNSCWSKETNIFDPAARMFSTIGQPNWLGAFLAINFFIALYFFIKNLKNTKYFILNTLYLALNFSCILFSRSRSAFGAVLVGLLIYSIYHYIFIKKGFRKALITLLVITVFPILFFKTGIDKIDNLLSMSNLKSQITNEYQITNKKNQNKTVLDNSDTNLGVTDSLDIRKIVWKGAIDLGFKYPLFGTGLETFAFSYYFVRPVAHNLTSEWDYLYNKAHNEYLNYFATTGFTGLIAYMVLIGGFLFYAFKISNIKYQISNKYQNPKSKKDYQKSDLLKEKLNKQLLVVTLSLAYLTILITNFVGFSTTTINLFFYLIPAIIFTQFASNDEKNSKFDFHELNRMQWLLIIFYTVFEIYIIFSISVYFMADYYYARAIGYSNPKVNDFQKAAGLYEKAINLRRETAYEDKFSYSLAYLSGIASYQKNPDLAKKFMEASEFYNLKSLKSSPKNALYWKTRAKNKYLFYLVDLNQNELEMGIEALMKAQALSPTDPKIPYSLAVFYSIMADAQKNIKDKNLYIAKSFESVDEALNLKPNFQDAIDLKAQLQAKYE
ncbi:MAG: hypothetical protein UR68_C0017G0002 [Candidatus Roizmanbacteria bacterium GW2011_GWA2_35_19]|uniref:O-antigen ligase-related domain-containing protein n=2 Tax=Candidatus Roizmaniibacteriota TaxID=1752723 RepID=A0A0G0C878_9BACT|nr:MAG: hypothetical protein UR63_C0003G0002 [Candidatus Roizmanbacteria bacterium GW2011_GWC2_35_12]KKP72326.1 MAG: hypothetical protein UR68_C0017G0002 [Candidatus Roizmanbacteria bacterium GW2011_GWA2_35_19]